MMPFEGFEPERYELAEEPPYRFELNRREFVGIAGAGLLILTSSASAQRGGFGGQPTTELSARLHIGEDGAITVFTSKVEVGQGSRTQLTQAAAEELGVPVEQVRLVMADTDLVPDDGGTAGSRTTPSTVPAVRTAAAAAREILIEAGCRRWNLERGRVELRDGAVVDPAGGRKLSYSDLARTKEPENAFRGTIPPGVAVKATRDWKVLGKPVGKTTGREIVTGGHRYPSDIVRPSMVYGKLLRPPAYGATLAAVDLEPARTMPGVTVVRDGSFVGCAAPSSWKAQKALEAIAATARWETAPHPSSRELFEHLRRTAVTGGDGRRGPMVRTRGSASEALASAKRVVRATYTVAYIQHAPMEPRAAVAEWSDGKVTVWTGTQMPHRVRQQVAEAFRIPVERVRVIVPDTGGGFGGKHSGEVAVEAARLAKEAGRPVSLRWTRQEEFAWAYFRPAGLFEIQAGLDGAGKIVAWDYSNYNAGTAGLDTPYQIANVQTRFLYTDSPLREGSYRGIAATANNFAREAFMDELAEAAGADPLEFRLANLENPRLRAVLSAAAERFGWKQRKQARKPGTGVGIACGTEKGSYVAACVEVSLAAGGLIRVHDACHVFECGAIQNPVNLRAQVEGCIIMGLGGALTEEIAFENGKLLNGSFVRYRMPHFRDVPPMENVLLDRPDLPSAGAGETPIIAIAPAIAAAVHDAGGGRSRSMPVRVLPAQQKT